MKCPACKGRLVFADSDVTTCLRCKTRVSRVPGVSGAKFLSDPERPWFKTEEDLKSAIVRQVELVQKMDREKKAALKILNADLREAKAILLDMTKDWNRFNHGKSDKPPSSAAGA